MRLKIFTLKFSNASDGFDDSPMQDFLADKEVIETREHFYVHERIPYLTVLVSYRDVEADERRKYAARARSKDPRDELDEMEKAAYDALRSWRGARARQDGVPSYIIANNRQLAKVVKLRAASRADLLKVEGIGEEKANLYAAEILQVLAGVFGAAPIPASDTG